MMIVPILIGENIVSTQQLHELYSYLGGTLYGSCNGFFGRGNYRNKHIEGLGALWVVAREKTWFRDEEIDIYNLAIFDSTEDLLKRLKQWSDPSLTEE